MAANFESGTWITYDSKLLNLENLNGENDTSNAMHILRHFLPTSISRSGRLMDQNKAAMAQLVSTIDIDHVKSKNQDKEGILDDQKPVVLSNLNGVETSTNAENAQVEWNLLCAEGVHELDS